MYFIKILTFGVILVFINILRVKGTDDASLRLTSAESENGDVTIFDTPLELASIGEGQDQPISERNPRKTRRWRKMERNRKSANITAHEEKHEPSTPPTPDPTADHHPSTEKPSHPFNCTAPGQVPIRNECFRFNFCAASGAAPAIKDCPKDKAFHHRMRSCYVMNEEACRSLMCKSEHQRFPDPHARSSYLSCENMFPEVVHCPEGDIYNIHTMDCEPSPVAHMGEIREPLPNPSGYKEPKPHVESKNVTET